MAEKKPFFDIFSDFAPDFTLRRHLGDAYVTDMVLETEKRALTLELEAPEEFPAAAVAAAETLLAQRYELNAVRLHVHAAPPSPEAAKGAEKKPKAKPKRIMGGEIKGRVTPMNELTATMGRAVVEGKVFKFDCHETRRPGMWVVIIELTDYTGSVVVRRNMMERETKPLQDRIVPGMWLRIAGTMELTYDGKDIQLNPRDISEVQHEGRKDNAPVKRVELHLHTKMSNMDALTDTKSVVKLAASWGMPAIAITDHGVAQAFPDAWKAAGDKIKILYGCEGYFVNNLDDRIAVHGTQDGDFHGEIICFDIETTGLKVTQEAITEIGAVLLRDGEIVDTFQTFVDPERRLTPEIVGLTGITDAMLRGAPKLQDALRAFLDFAGGRILAAHNAEFDISFIRAGCRKCGISFEPTYLDSLIFAQNLLPGLKNYKLDVVAEHLRLPAFNHHRASDDAVPVAQMLAKFFPMLQERGVTRIQQINNEMLKLRPQGGKGSRFPKHIILIAQNKTGLKNLYQLISASNLKYFKRVPIIPKTELVAHREGILVGSACEAGELFRAVVDHKDWDELKRIASFYDYLEIQPICNNRFMIREGKAKDDEELRDYNRTIVKLGEELGKPVCATGDVHFQEPEDEEYRHILLASKKFADANQPLPIYFRTTDEMLKEFEYLGKEKAYEVVVTNTRAIADRVEVIELLPKGKLFPPRLENSEEELNTMVWAKAHELYGDPLPQLITDRLNVELGGILGKYDVVYMSAQKLVQRSLENGYLVGSRGSVGSSLVAYMAGITEVNSLPPHYRCPKCKNVEFVQDGSYGCGADMPDKVCPKCGTKYIKDGFDIPFETFLGYGGGKVPDIDLNFSGEYQAKAHQYCVNMFGASHVFRAGTIGTVKEDTAFPFVRDYLEARNLPSGRSEVKRLINGCLGVRRTTGQHPGGLVVIPQENEIWDFCPVQHPADDAQKNIITTHFEYHSMEENLLKLDMLGHDDPTMIRMMEDLTGVNAQKIPLDDKETMSIFTSSKVLGYEHDPILTEVGSVGIPEFGTGFTREMLKDTMPTQFDTLIRLSGFSHGTDVWLGNAKELIVSGTATVGEAIGCRDDIMLYLIKCGLPEKRAFKIMESVRKGKGLPDGAEKEMLDAGVPSWYIGSCKKIKYLFPKAHAVAYVMMAFRIAWFKVHHPLAYYSAYFYRRSQKDSFDAVMMTHGIETVKAHIKRINDNENKTDKDKDHMTTLEVCYEFYLRGFDFANLDLYESHATKFLIKDGKLLPPFVAVSGLGETAAWDIMKGREGRHFISIEEFAAACPKVSKTHIENMKTAGAFGDLPETNQIRLF